MNSTTAPEHLASSGPSALSEMQVDNIQPPTDVGSTPFKSKTHSVSGYSSSEIITTIDKTYTSFWATRLSDNSRVCQGIDKFLEDFVPGEEPPSKCPVGIFSDFKPDGSEEDYVGMVTSLNKLMEYFPEDRRITFVATNNVRFNAIFSSEHHTRPDIAGTYPGQPAPRSWNWNLCPIDIELKSKEDKCPVKYINISRGDAHDAALTQIAKNGRNILAASGACFCFVVGIYGSLGRIYRFDHAGVLISPSFRIKAMEPSNILFRFLWRIVHPQLPAPLYGDVLSRPKLVGLDATVTSLTEEEKTWLRDTLINCHGYEAKLANERVDQSKKKVAMYMPLNSGPTAEPAPKWCYTIGKPLSQSSGLFSRATKVEKVLFREDPDHFFAVKDSWRHVYRQNEIDFYNHVRNCYVPNYPRGLAQGIGAIDFGLDARFPWHRTKSRETSAAKDALSASGQAKQDDVANQQQLAPTPTVPEAVNPWAYDALFPLQLPQTEIRKPGDANPNRSLTRTTTYPVGEPIVEFTSTKQLVEAIRDAIEGHKALMDCGLIHRDVSGSNVLLTTSGESKGFLHDFDYSTYVREWNKFAGQDLDDHLLCAHSSSISRELKEITGTFQFLARDILDGYSHLPKHDLESFFWLLSWVSFRHVDHGGTMDKVKKALDFPDPYIASSVKDKWLRDVVSRRITIDVSGNEPFGQLYYGFARLFREDEGSTVHPVVLGVFDDMLNGQHWPENDGSRTYKPCKANPYYNSIGNPHYSSIEDTRSSKRKAQHEAEDQPTGRSSRVRTEDLGN